MRCFVDDEAFALMEHRRVRHVIVRTIRAAKADDLDWRFMSHHMTDLHSRGVRAEQLALAFAFFGFVVRQIESIVHFARRVAGREIERSEIMEVILDVRTFGNRKAHVAENRYELFHRLSYRVDRAFPVGTG